MTDIADLLKLSDAALALIEEENRRVGAGEAASAFPELIESKIRLSDQLIGAMGAFRARASGQATAPTAGDSTALQERLSALQAAVAENDRLLRAKLGVTEDLIATVLSTARAQRSATMRGYSDDGRPTESHRPAAIAIDRAV